ncbi:hypothetical protein LguiB_020469 [Lonicera macranthoides]
MDSSICLWIWFDNVPHPKLIEYKKDRNWMCNSDDCLIFPGGDTQLKDGVHHYIYKIEQVHLGLAFLFLEYIIILVY